MSTEKSCCNCAKLKRSSNTCAVLKDTIGYYGGCFAWSDDPYWHELVKDAVKIYSGKKSVRRGGGRRA